MSIILDGSTRVVVQGITGRAGRYHVRQMLDYGTAVVAGTSPRPEVREVDGVPVFPSLAEAMHETQPELVLCLVGARDVRSGVVEAIDANAKSIVVLAEGVPLHDALRLRGAARRAGCLLIGPNTNGVMSPGRAKVGFFPAELAKLGTIGIVSRSGTLGYGASVELLARGLGQSTVVGIGGDRCRGVGFVDCLRMFFDDPDTNAVLMLGEIGGGEEQSAAELMTHVKPKPVVAYIAGRTAPRGVAMGHAGALIHVDEEAAEAKERALTNAGVVVARTIGQAAELLRESI